MAKQIDAGRRFDRARRQRLLADLERAIDRFERGGLRIPSPVPRAHRLAASHPPQENAKKP